jgi:hypothetical protein
MALIEMEYDTAMLQSDRNLSGRSVNAMLETTTDMSHKLVESRDLGVTRGGIQDPRHFCVACRIASTSQPPPNAL